jgi:hypothetical protein
MKFPGHSAETFWKPCKIELGKARVKVARLLASEPPRKRLVDRHRYIWHRFGYSANLVLGSCVPYTWRAPRDVIRNGI